MYALAVVDDDDDDVAPPPRRPEHVLAPGSVAADDGGRLHVCVRGAGACDGHSPALHGRSVLEALGAASPARFGGSGPLRVHYCRRHGRAHWCLDADACTLTTESAHGFRACALSARTVGGALEAAYGDVPSPCPWLTYSARTQVRRR